MEKINKNIAKDGCEANQNVSCFDQKFEEKQKQKGLNDFIIVNIIEDLNLGICSPITLDKNAQSCKKAQMIQAN